MKPPSRIPLVLDCGHGCTPIHLTLEVEMVGVPGGLEVRVINPHRVGQAARVHMKAVHHLDC